MVDRTTGLTNKQGAADDFDADLRGETGAGMNAGMRSPHPEKGDALRTAYDAKSLHGRLAGFTDDELRQIALLPEGARLEGGATYLDLADPVPTEITAHGTMEAGKGHFYVAKSETDYELWNRLRGITDPERTRPLDDTESGDRGIIS